MSRFLLTALLTGGGIFSICMGAVLTLLGDPFGVFLAVTGVMLIYIDETYNA